MANSQTIAEYFAGQTSEQLIGFAADDVTQAELAALREYASRTAGTPDTLDQVDSERDLDYLRNVAPLMTTWSEALQSLDEDTSPHTTGKPRSGSTDLFLRVQKEAFDDVRDALLHAIAASAGVGVTRWRSW